MARMSEAPWDVQVLLWQPSRGSGRVGRTCLRWADEIDSFMVELLGGDWFLYAQDEEAWNHMESAFAERCFQCSVGYLPHVRKEPSSSSSSSTDLIAVVL